MRHRTQLELEAALGDLRGAPRDPGVLELIVRRPQPGVRESVPVAALDPDLGLIGDNWATRGSSRTVDGAAHPEMQLTLMSRRAIALIAGDPARWPLAGDQLYVDFDLSLEHLPAGSRVQVGAAAIEITAVPHTGCKKFVERFGLAATQFFNSTVGRELRLRGVNAKVLVGGQVRCGDELRKLGS